MLRAQVLALHCLASQLVAAPPTKARRSRRPKKQAPGHVQAASSDLPTLPEREREAAPPTKARRPRRPKKQAPGHVQTASSDLLTLPEREREAAERLRGKTPTLEEAIRAHLDGTEPVLRRDLRVLVARDRVDGELHEVRVAQLAAFREELTLACDSLALSRAEADCVSSVFVKAAAHRVDPMKHERRAVEVLSAC